jgi:hypothetical protein
MPALVEGSRREKESDMSTIPRIGVFLAGTEGSGKTSYRVGMYATLVGGLVTGCSLHSSDRRKGLEMLNTWDEFASSGKLITPTAVGLAETYPFTFRFGLEPWLDFEIMDYRGSVFDDPNDEDGDVAAMLRHLGNSSSIYLTLDGSYLAEPVTGANRAEVARGLKLNQLTDPLDRAIARARVEIRPMPSVVFLLTKSDKLRSRFASGNPTQREWLDLINDLKQLLPLAFSPGISALVCPVRIGMIDEDHDPSGWSTGQADPKNLHLPIAFTLLYHLQVEHADVSARLSPLKKQLETATARKRELELRFFKFKSVQNELQRLSRSISELEGPIADASEEVSILDSRTADLRGLLTRVPILQDGLVVNMELMDSLVREPSSA